MPKSSYEYNGVIEEYRGDLTDLTALVDSKKVTKKQGQYNYAKRSDYQGFNLIVPESEFKPGEVKAAVLNFAANSIEYEIGRYTGIAVFDEDMEEDDAGLEAAIERFITYEDIVTKNREILAAFKVAETAKGGHSCASFDDVTAAFEILGVNHMAYAAAVTNESGLKKLKAFKDGTGASVVKSGDDKKPALEISGYTIPVIVFADSFLQSDSENGAPLELVDLYEAIALFNHGKLKALRTVSAKSGDSYLFSDYQVGYQAATEFDVEFKDLDAIVCAYLA